MLHILSFLTRMTEANESVETQSFVLNFHGRVSLASVKNFQIVADDDLDHVAMQFGRVSQDEFSLDVRYPLAPLQALGVAMTAFGPKFACE